jgi:hypothetical protein
MLFFMDVKTGFSFAGLNSDTGRFRTVYLAGYLYLGGMNLQEAGEVYRRDS